MKNNIKKNFIWNMIGSSINAIPSLLFLIIVTRINGKNDAGIFTFAFSMACLFQVIGFYSGRTFQVTNHCKKIDNCDFFYNRITTNVLMILFVIIFLFFKHYDFTKSFLLLLFVIYRLIDAISDSFYAVIQKDDRLYQVGISLTIKGVLSVFSFFIVDYIFSNMIYSTISIVIINFIILIFYDIRKSKSVFKIRKYNNENNLNLLSLGFSVFAFTFLTQLILNIPKYVIDNHLSSSYQAIYGIIVMPATFIVLCSQFVIQPFLIKIKRYIEQRKMIELRDLTFKIAAAVLFVGAICVIGAYIAGIPLLKLVYGINLDKYLVSLIIIIIGATCFALSYVFSTVLVALDKNIIQLIFYVIASIFMYIISNFLIIDYGVLGASISYSVTMFFLVIAYFLYFILLLKKITKEYII